MKIPRDQKYLLEKFKEHLLQKFNRHCQLKGQATSEKGLLSFLIEEKLFPQQTLRKFTVKEEFLEIANEHQFTKSQMVKTIAEILDIPERAVWGILKNEKLKKGNT